MSEGRTIDAPQESKHKQLNRWATLGYYYNVGMELEALDVCGRDGGGRLPEWASGEGGAVTVCSMPS